MDITDDSILESSVCGFNIADLMTIGWGGANARLVLVPAAESLFEQLLALLPAEARFRHLASLLRIPLLLQIRFYNLWIGGLKKKKKKNRQRAALQVH